MVTISLDTTRNAIRYRSIVRLGLETWQRSLFKSNNALFSFFLFTVRQPTLPRIKGKRDKTCSGRPSDRSILDRVAVNDGRRLLATKQPYLLRRISRGAIKLAVFATCAPSNRRKLLYRAWLRHSTDSFLPVLISSDKSIKSGRA